MHQTVSENMQESWANILDEICVSDRRIIWRYCDLTTQPQTPHLSGQTPLLSVDFGVDFWSFLLVFDRFRPFLVKIFEVFFFSNPRNCPNIFVYKIVAFSHFLPKIGTSNRANTGSKKFCCELLFLFHFCPAAFFLGGGVLPWSPSCCGVCRCKPEKKETKKQDKKKLKNDEEEIHINKEKKPKTNKKTWGTKISRNRARNRNRRRNNRWCKQQKMVTMMMMMMMMMIIMRNEENKNKKMEQ